MDKISITKPQALKALRKAVAAKGPDFVYEHVNRACLYAQDGQPGCLVGTALYILGVPVDVLEQIDIDGAYTDTEIESVADMTLKEAGVHFSPKALEIFAVAQRWQDEGWSWGKALERAENT